MAVIYSGVSTHPILTGKSKALAASDSAAFAAQQELAETLLGLTEPAVTNAFTLSRVQLAVALQINFQLEQGLDPLVEEVAQSKHSEQMIKYRDRIVNPQAASIIADVLVVATVDRWASITSLRTRDD